jgi:FkbM family methyltransferase
MNPLLRAVDWSAAAFNGLPVWKGECRVWQQRMVSPTFERWLYLKAHRFGLMGSGERAFLEQNIRPGMHVLDVGSNVGLYSILMARLAGKTGRVTCFEPEPDLFAALRRNAELSGVTCIEAHNLALGAAPAELVLHRSIINSGDNHLGQRDGQLFRRAVTTKVVRLDDFLPRLKLDLIKIDVQGWELEVLRGMRGTLAANGDVRVYFEFSPNCYARAGSTYGELIAFLREAGLRIFDPAARRELDDAAVAALARSLGPSGYTNLLAARQPGY